MRKEARGCVLAGQRSDGSMRAGVFSLAALLPGLDKWRGPRGTGDGAPRTGPPSVQIHEGDGAAGLSCCSCSLTLSWSAASLHLLCALLLVALP